MQKKTNFDNEQPRIHLGALLRTSDDAHTSGEISALSYQQGEETQTLRFAVPASYEVSINCLGGDEMYLQGLFSPTLIMECARCLCDVDVPLEIDLSILMRYEPSVDEPYLEEAESGESLLVFGDPNLDLSLYLAETTLLEAPTYVLHDPNCLGLCQECGHDLNKEGCGKDPTLQTCAQRRPVPIEELDAELGTPAGSTHAKQNPFAALQNLDLPNTDGPDAEQD